MIKMSHDVA